MHKLPKETQGKTTECMCHVPWNQRSSWDCRGFVQYQLPAVTSLWESRLAEEVHETVWVEQSAPVDKPVVMFTIGTMPNFRHSMRKLCLAWYPILLESVEAVRGEESEEEKRTEESEPTKQRWFVAPVLIAATGRQPHRQMTHDT